jgi:hypothetical protein
MIVRRCTAIRSRRRDHHARADTGEHTKDRALLDAAIAYTERGAAAARAALVGAGAPSDRELAFWAAELDYRSSRYEAAHDQYKALLAEPAPQFRGRIYDHYSSVLLYLDEPDEALRVGTFHPARSRGGCAVGVRATLRRPGKLDAASPLPRRAAAHRGEHTRRLAKVLALKAMNTSPRDDAALTRRRAVPTPSR